MDQASKTSQVALACGMQHCAGAEKQKTLHERMIERVVQHGDQSERRGSVHPGAGEQNRESHARKNDADVLDRRVRQQTFHIGLRGREDYAVQRCEQTECERDQAPPPQRLAAAARTALS